MLVHLLQYAVHLYLEIAVCGCLLLPSDSRNSLTESVSPGTGEYIGSAGNHTAQMSGLTAGVWATGQNRYAGNKNTDNGCYPYRYREEKDKNYKMRKKYRTGCQHTEYGAGSAYHRRNTKKVHRYQ